MVQFSGITETQAAVNRRCLGKVLASESPASFCANCWKPTNSKALPAVFSSRSHKGLKRLKVAEEKSQAPSEGEGFWPEDYPDFGEPTEKEMEGGYTPFQFVHFGDQELTHHLQIEVNADAQRCYELWADASAFLPCFEFVEDCTPMPSESYEGQETAGITIMYTFGTYPTLELKFVAQCTEQEPGSVVAFESLCGLPIAGAVELMEGTQPGVTQVHASVVYKMPVELGLFEEPLAVHRNVEYFLNKYLQNFKQLAEN